MAVFAIPRTLFRRFYSCSSAQVINCRQTNSSYLFTYFHSRFDSQHLRYYSKTKWITIILEKADGTHLKRKGKIGETLWDVLYGDPDFPGFGECEASQACATCHVIFTKEDFNTISKYNCQSVKEMDLLDGLSRQFPANVTGFRSETSRLGCCVELIPEMDGKVIKLPKIEQLIET